MTTIRESIERDTRALALPRGRRVGQPGHDVARKYLLQRMTDIGLAPFRGAGFELPFRRLDPATHKDIAFSNLVGVVRGTQADSTPLLIGAHYDSAIDGPCADDNAASVAVVLAAAERFVRSPLKKDLIVAIFDAEEPPYFLSESMGSVRFCQDHCADLNFTCAIILDLIAHDVELGTGEVHQIAPGLKDLIFVMGAESDRALPPVVERAAAAVAGLRVLPTLHKHVGDMSDHAAFRMGDQPFLFLSCGQGRYYHHPKDDMAWVNLDKIVRVYELVSQLLLAAQDISTAHPARDHDPADFEIRMIHRALGDALPLLLSLFGMDSLSSRADLDHLADMLKQEI